MRRNTATMFFASLLASFGACEAMCPQALHAQSWQPTDSAKAASERIAEPELRGHIQFLADDLLEGRGPGSRGDQLAQRYIQTQLQGMGLQPGAGNGSWYQTVPLRGIRTTPPTSIHFRRGSETLVLDHKRDMMATSGRPDGQVAVKDAELVFVGYGIQAPEYDWDDYKGMDLSGKVLVVLNNDPEDDPELFAGKRRLYYGRWDYKYSMAAKMGAAGALIIHTTASAGYPYQVVQTSWSGEEFELAGVDGKRTSLKGWVTADAAYKLAKLAEQDLDTLRAAAQKRDFRPVPLGVKVSLQMQCDVREQVTGNVVGVLPGTDPVLKDEYVVFMAHHDHLGLASTRDENGDLIYNGAIDNASGTASLLTIARAVASLETRPRRSVMFAFVGAEEQGLLGSKYLAAAPPVPAGNMAAVINIDGINHLGRTRDINLIGNGKSDLDRIVEAVAAWQERIVVPDYFPDRGYYYRSDQFSLAQIGVPGIYLHSGVNVIGKPDGWGKAKLDEWVERTYHQPSDEYDPSWDLAGAIDDARLLMLIGLQIANQESMPSWLPGDEFEAARKDAIEKRRRAEAGAQ